METDQATDINARLIAALDQEVGRTQRLVIEQRLMIESLTVENRQTREIAGQLMEQHGPGQCQPVLPVEAAEVVEPEPTPLRPDEIHTDCPGCIAERSG